VSVARTNNKEKETLVLNSIRKEVNEKFAETDSLFVGINEYSKSNLLLALGAKNPTLMTLLVNPTTQRISKKPEEEKLLLLYLGETSSSETQKANPTAVDYTIKALEKEVSSLGPEEKLYIGSREYSRDELLLALSGRDPLIMEHIVIPASKSFFEKEEYKELLLGYLQKQNQNKKSPPRNISLGQENEKKICLLINPRFDRASNFSYAWSVALIPALKSMGWDVITIGNREVRRLEVERAIEERNPELIIFYDHGKPDSLMGARTEPVFNIENARRLKDREVYTTACLSALDLGKAAARIGSKVYWGSSKPIMLTTTSNWVFKRHQNAGILRKIMAPQLSWDDAFDYAYKVGDNLVKFLIGEGKPLESSAILNNNNGLTAYVREKKRVPEGEEKESRLPSCFRIFSPR